jgi:hypothetical protein
VCDIIIYTGIVVDSIKANSVNISVAKKEPIERDSTHRRQARDSTLAELNANNVSAKQTSEIIIEKTNDS